jgi:hypothetical protein
MEAAGFGWLALVKPYRVEPAFDDALHWEPGIGLVVELVPAVRGSAAEGRLLWRLNGRENRDSGR